MRTSVLFLGLTLLTAPLTAQASDSMYRRARESLNRNEYATAATLFRDIRSRYPRSEYAPDSYYWEAYARYRIGGRESLRNALRLLQDQARSHASASTRNAGDAELLETRTLRELAKLGDADAARRLSVIASSAGTPSASATASPSASASASGRRSRGGGRRDCDDEDDVQAAALNAVLQMNSERAIPILEKVLARRDPESVCLRRKAIFIVSQHKNERVEQMLLDAVKTDPDAEVREQAVFWLSQVNSPRSTAALESLLVTSQDRAVQEKAIFSLSQQNRPEARQALRNYASRDDAPEDLRDNAVFWLGQSNDAENLAFLQGLYGKVRSEELKERILFSVSQSPRVSGDWFAGVARNTNEPIELRKKALFWMGQRGGTTGTELAALYDSFSDREIKDQMIFVLSQRGKDRTAVDKLFDIVRNEPDKELKKKALFWLTQTNDPRVTEMLSKILIP